MGTFTESNIKFGIDLLTAASNELHFLEHINTLKYLQDESFIRRAIYRYEKYWLPLAAQFEEETLVAPVDIEWVWHCHMLSPHLYYSDCISIVGKHIDHSIVPLKDREKKLKNTRLKWTELYPNKPFEITNDVNDPGNIQIEHVSSLSYDLLSAVLRQGIFYYQVSLPHYRCSKFLKDAIVRYKKYLYLKRTNLDEFLVPCYDIDVIWHAHQQHPVIYKSDMETIVGKFLSHDDSVTDRKPDSKLYNADHKTRELWSKTYNESFSCHGAMFRGNPKMGKLYEIQRHETYMFSSKQATIDIDYITIEGKDLSKQQGQYEIKILTKDSSLQFQQLKKAKSTTPSWRFKSGECRFNYHTWENASLKFELTLSKGFQRLGFKKNLGSYTDDSFSLNQVEPFDKKDGGTIELNGLLESYQINVTGRLFPPVQSKGVFYIETGNYTKVNVQSENEDDMWGPIPVRELLPGVENTCSVAFHR